MSIDDKVAIVTGAGGGIGAATARLLAARGAKVVEVNLRGVLNGIVAALPVVRARDFGQFVNTASTAAFITTPTMAVYSAVKTAV